MSDGEGQPVAEGAQRLSQLAHNPCAPVTESVSEGHSEAQKCGGQPPGLQCSGSGDSSGTHGSAVEGPTHTVDGAESFATAGDGEAAASCVVPLSPATCDGLRGGTAGDAEPPRTTAGGALPLPWLPPRGRVAPVGISGAAAGPVGEGDESSERDRPRKGVRMYMHPPSSAGPEPDKAKPPLVQQQQQRRRSSRRAGWSLGGGATAAIGSWQNATRNLIMSGLSGPPAGKAESVASPRTDAAGAADGGDEAGDADAEVRCPPC